jgi:hypothetical protein
MPLFPRFDQRKLVNCTIGPTVGLSGYHVGNVERIGVGLIRVRRTVSEHDHLSAAAQRPHGFHQTGSACARAGEMNVSASRDSHKNRIAYLLVFIRHDLKP